jgi:Dolichyl-phosphate-mannose-protein mannosyltransferase
MSVAAPAITKPNSTPRWLRTDAVVLLMAGVVLVLFRLHAFDLPLETDECNYAYIGQQLLEGDRLYVDVWDHQPPGVFALFAGAISVFGNDPIVFRWLATVASLVTLVCIYGCSLRAFGRECAICVAVLFAIVSSDPGTGGEGCNREIFMNALIAVAWYVVLHRDRPLFRHLLIAGLALGLASVIKTIVAVHWLLLAIELVINHLRKQRDDGCTGYKPVPHGNTGKMPVPHKNNPDLTPEPQALACADVRTPGMHRLPTELVTVGLGPACIWLATSAYFAATGRFGLFYDAVFGFNLGYSEGGGSFFRRFVVFFTPERFPFLFDSAMVLWWVTAVAVVWLVVRTVRGDRACGLILAWILGAFIAICLPARFWPHYYYLMIPPACIAVAWVCLQLAKRLGGVVGSVRGVQVAVCGALVLGVLATEYRSYLDQPLFGITVKRYNSRDFWGRGQGGNIKRVTDPGDKIFVYGNDASFYYYSDRKCASRYTMITGIGKGMVGADDRRRIMMDELRNDPPRLIVILFDEPLFPAWKAFLDEFYGEPVGADFHDKTGKPIMFVMARKDQPIESIDWNWDRSSVGGWQLGERPR